MNKITPCLWFDNQLGEAMNFYGSVFPGFEVLISAGTRRGLPTLQERSSPRCSGCRARISSR